MTLMIVIVINVKFLKERKAIRNKIKVVNIEKINVWTKQERLLFSEESDRLVWRHSIYGFFSVASAYQMFDDLRHASDPPLVSEFPSLPLIWNSYAHSKVVVFSWQLLLRRFLLEKICLKERLLSIWRLFFAGICLNQPPIYLILVVFPLVSGIGFSGG